MAPADPAITRLLHSWRSGTPGAGDELVTVVYDRLRKLAGSYLRGERPGHTLAATAMRRVLVDHAKYHNRQRRGGRPVRAELDETMLMVGQPDPAILEIDEAIERLAKKK